MFDCFIACSVSGVHLMPIYDVFILKQGLVKNAARAAPVVGTVSPLITWGRTLNTNLPLADRERYAYVVYT